MKRVKRAVWPGLLAVVLVSIALPRAQPAELKLDRLARFCLDDLVRFPEILVIDRIPVGCEVVDCCPGCPGPGPIDWRIRLEGEPLEAVELAFDNLPADRAGEMKFEGDAKSTPTGVRVGKGEAMIRGLPGGAGRPPVARIRLVPDKAWLSKQTAAGGGMADEADSSRDVGRIQLTIEQLVGRYVVHEYRVSYGLYLCPRPPGDRIDLNNNAANDQAVVLLDGRRASCVNDEVRRGNDLIPLGNVLSNQNCRSEVSVFSDDDAMRFVTNVTAWTDSSGDLLPIDQTPNRLLAPVTVWLARANAQAIAQADIANANLLYNSNNVGIGFAATLNDVSGNQNAVNTINGSIGCANLGALQGSAFFTAGRLNVYYVNSAFTGVNCNANRNIQLVGTTANNQTLAHEFGHSMSLGHTNNMAGFPQTNVMMGGGANRTHFSEGQGFRLNVHCSSTVNANGVRTGPVRNCGDTIAGNITCPAGDTHCPALALDVQPK